MVMCEIMSIDGKDRGTIMKSKLACQCALLIASAFLTVFTVHAQSVNPNETLRQYVADL